MGWARRLAPGQSCRVRVADAATGEVRTVHIDRSVLLEAPNWSRAGDLVLNGDGVLWRLAADASGGLEQIAIEQLPELNNDHVLAPDGETVYLSANDGNIYAAPIAGGTAARITRAPDDRYHFLHGVRPDGERLAYVSLHLDAGWQSAVVRTVGVDGEEDAPVTVPPGPDDGPEYSPDGAWIYFNTERFSTVPGHAQIARVRPDGTGIEQLTFDERVNWFPHVSPDGTRAVHLSFPPGTEGHPADLPVQLKVIAEGRWSEPAVVLDVFGGQGTINVNSWSPDGAFFAFVDYPMEGQQ
ncbi:transporter [Microbacter sp. GSS18]|nr:transporter [Microbacter sp. GSS18]